LEQLAVPFLLLVLRVDILHFHANAGPFVKVCPTVGTIHWVTDAILRAAFPWYKRVYFALAEKLSLCRAERLIAVSKACKADAVATYGADLNRITVIPHGVSRVFGQGADQGDKRPRGDSSFIREPYVLCVTTSLPYKNLTNVFLAYAVARQKHDVRRQLVLVGDVPQEALREFEDMSADLDGVPAVVATGYVPYRDMPRVYRGARLLLYVSLRETFGIPVVEAMSAGVPAVVSDIPALREVTDGAALVVNPNNAEEIASAIRDLEFDEKLRTDLITKGLLRAGSFTWQEAARRTVEVYGEVLRGTHYGPTSKPLT
jgi:alpha-1,3-rhamnosyl/mannosyltransferase